MRTAVHIQGVGVITPYQEGQQTPSGGVERVSKGRKDKRLGGETPLRLQKSVLFLGNYHIGLAKQPHVRNEEWNLGGWLPERNSCLETHWTRNTQPHWSDKASTIFATTYTFCTGCKRERKPRASTMFSKESQTYHSQNNLCLFTNAPWRI